MFVHFHFHIVELDFDTIKQSIVICGTRCDLIQCVDHLYNAVQDSLWQYQGEISRRSIECRCDKGLLDTLPGRTLSTDQVSETLYHHATAKHIGKSGD